MDDHTVEKVIKSMEEKPPIPRMFCDNPNCFLHKAFVGDPNIVTVERFDGRTLLYSRTYTRKTACLLSHFSGMAVMLCDSCRDEADAGTLKWSGKVSEGGKMT